MRVGVGVVERGTWLGINADQFFDMAIEIAREPNRQPGSGLVLHNTSLWRLPFSNDMAGTVRITSQAAARVGVAGVRNELIQRRPIPIPPASSRFNPRSSGPEPRPSGWRRTGPQFHDTQKTRTQPCSARSSFPPASYDRRPHCLGPPESAYALSNRQ